MLFIGKAYAVEKVAHAADGKSNAELFLHIQNYGADIKEQMFFDIGVERLNLGLGQLSRIRFIIIRQESLYPISFEYSLPLTRRFFIEKETVGYLSERHSLIASEDGLQPVSVTGISLATMTSYKLPALLRR